MSLKEEKRGQVTIFIIIAILVIALGVLLYIFYPKLVSTAEPETRNPSAYLDECLRDIIEENVETISLNGGNYKVSENFAYLSQGNYFTYLCYTDADNVPCVNQQPFLIQHVESEIIQSIQDDVDACLVSIVEMYEGKGYETEFEEGIHKSRIYPSRISTTINYTLVLTKGEELQKYENTDISFNSDLYNILEIASEIINFWEPFLGDTDNVAYTTESLKENALVRVEQHEKDDQITLYTITNEYTKEVFRFAVRSLTIPV